MKVVGLSILRTGPGLDEPLPLAVANDLSSFGYFQRQVRDFSLLFLTGVLILTID